MSITLLSLSWFHSVLKQYIAIHSPDGCGGPPGLLVMCCCCFPPGAARRQWEVFCSWNNSIIRIPDMTLCPRSTIWHRNEPGRNARNLSGKIPTVAPPPGSALQTIPCVNPEPLSPGPYTTDATHMQYYLTFNMLLWSHNKARQIYQDSLLSF